MTLIQFYNCRILRNHIITQEDFWIRNGCIVDPFKIFYEEKVVADVKIDCENAIIAPGFIDLQINGGFGYDFSYDYRIIEKSLKCVAKNLVGHGVTAFCPTIVTSPTNVYHEVLQRITPTKGGLHGASILGVHAEGPFINCEKKGAHPAQCIKRIENGLESIQSVYGHLDNIKIITLAPELLSHYSVINDLIRQGIIVSLGHSMATLSDGEKAVSHGATLITHLFNAMLPFHHRDPGLVGLLTSDKLPIDKTIYFGIISDGIHTHPAALRIAYRVHPAGLVLVTDAISALGLEDGKHNIGQLSVEIRDGKAFISGTDTLCGSITSMIECVRRFYEITECSKEYVLEAASLHPALALRIADRKGTLNFGSDADFILLNDKLDLISTWISGQCVYGHKAMSLPILAATGL